MSTWRNATGHTLSSPAWLEAHHRAKLRERRRFAESLVRYSPKRLVDLGCATGLWLEVLDEVLPSDCDFIGIDSDAEALQLAEERATSWNRKSEFILCDIASDPVPIPRGDLMLAFNIFPYMGDVVGFLEHLHSQRKAERIVIRQYDGDLIRIGPMSTEDREAIDSSLRASLQASAEFSHYDLDRTYDAVGASSFEIESLEFELTQRHSPFPVEFEDYFEGTIAWMMGHLSEHGRALLSRFLEDRKTSSGPLYVAQTDLVAVLSAAL